MVSTGNWSPFIAGYNGTCTGFNGNCNGSCWYLLVIGHLLLLVIMGVVLVLMETVLDPVGFYCNWSPFIGGLLKPIHLNGVCPKTHFRKHF